MQKIKTNMRRQDAEIKIKKIRFYQRLYTDNDTHDWSDTVLRTWIIFLVWFFYSLALIFLILQDLYLGTQKNFDAAFRFYEPLALFATGGGALYLGRNFAHRREHKEEES